MSLLINGMDMPKNCADCFFRQVIPNSLDVYFCYADKNNRYAVYDKRPSFCPLVEVSTPHGELIDRDNVIEEINRIFPCHSDEYEWAYTTVEQADTIIEAEE